MSLNNKGFTLIEILIYISIAVVFLLTLSSILVNVKASDFRETIIRDVEYQGENIVHIITQEIRSADSINSPGLGSSSDVLSLESSDAIRDPITFELSGGNIYMSEGGAEQVRLNNKNVIIEDVIFSNVSNVGTPGSIKIELEISYKGVSSISLSYQKTFYGAASLRQ